MGLMQLIRRITQVLIPTDGSQRNLGTWSLPAAAVMSALTTGAADYGAYVELITAANNTVDRWVEGVIVRADTTGENGTWNLAIGAAGSEVVFAQGLAVAFTAEDCLVIIFPHPIKIGAGRRIAARCWSDTDGATLDIKIWGKTGLGGAN